MIGVMPVAHLISAVAQAELRQNFVTHEVGVLLLHRACVRRGQDLVLRHVSLQCNAPGLLFLVGSGGAGKSSLLSAMSGGQASSSLTISGTAELCGKSLSTVSHMISWVPQRLRATTDVLSEMTENVPHASARADSAHGDGSLLSMDGDRALHGGNRERIVAIKDGLRRDASLYLLDEPTADLDPAQIDHVRNAIEARSRDAVVVVATHNRQDCLALGGRTALLAGGRILECAPSDQFFLNPETPAGRIYAETGNCYLPDTRSSTRRSNGIWWVVPGLLCGMSRPGLIANIDQQVADLHRSGVRRLLCLEERREYANAVLIRAGIGHHHFPVADMAPPALAQAVDFCRLAEASIRANEGVAVHCRGGLGRTGTGLAAILIWLGDSATAAIARIRRVEPFAIQSSKQIRFVHEFAERIRSWQLSSI